MLLIFVCTLVLFAIVTVFLVKEKKKLTKELKHERESKLYEEIIQPGRNAPSLSTSTNVAYMTKSCAAEDKC